MKVRDLIERLQALPQGAEVYLSTDAEGNEFSRLDQWDQAFIRKSDVGYGRTDEIIYEGDLDELELDEIREDVTEVIVLWPV